MRCLRIYEHIYKLYDYTDLGSLERIHGYKRESVDRESEIDKDGMGQHGQGGNDKGIWRY